MDGQRNFNGHAAGMKKHVENYSWKLFSSCSSQQHFLSNYLGDTLHCVTITFIFQVLRSEVSAIRRACASLEQGYEPSVTFLVVQKRHHTRFFPMSREDEDGRNRNVPAGTVVDTKITHPTELDFFLASHASIQVWFVNFIILHFKLNFSEFCWLCDDKWSHWKWKN